MIIKTASYISSCVDPKKCPEPKLPEYAFIGRSNVGKSSLINMLTGIGGLAKISSTPGKTQLINHFLINEQWYLVDLPGYGFAKVAKTVKKGWEAMILNYLAKRENLMSTFLLIDSRITVQKNDVHFINTLGERQISFVIVMTKCDKISKGQLGAIILELKNALKDTWDELPQIFKSSSKAGDGKTEILKFIESTNPLFENPIN